VIPSTLVIVYLEASRVIIHIGNCLLRNRTSYHSHW